MCRQLRLDNRLRQREVAAACGIKASSYGNVECNNHKTIALDRVNLLADVYGLNEQAKAEFIAAWNELPMSTYSAKQTKTYLQRRETRSKVKNHDRLKLSLLELAVLTMTRDADPDTLCSCPEPDLFAGPDEQPQPPCELCTALQLLGLTGYTTVADVMEKLAAIQDSMVTQ